MYIPLGEHSLLRVITVTTQADLHHRFSRDTVNGFSSLPVNYRDQPRVDGVAIRYTTLPGGLDPERAGGTLTHESGHWLGLRHTFAVSCPSI
jgi:Pregnancy-associated plasma protein-A